MIDPLVAFITGITAGGLSCLAVQAGLLATSVADQAEEDIEEELQNTEPIRYERGSDYERELQALAAHRFARKKHYTRAVERLKLKYPKQLVASDAPSVKPKRHPIKPIVLFLGSRLAAYTLLGFLLGWAGSVLQLTPQMRAGLQIAIGIFMLGTALRMLNVHPIFRYFAIEPPKKLTRYMRRKAKNGGEHVLMPVFLGALTVLIPCGITQVMMAAAIATGNPFGGALILFAYILGTSPIFFAVAYAATKLGGKLQAGFMKALGVVILVLAFIAIEGGLNLAGSPISFRALSEAWSERQGQTTAQTQDAATPSTSTQPQANATTGDVLKLTASTGYNPRIIKATANTPYKLEITSKDNQGCSRSFIIPALNIQEVLPENGVTTIDIPAQSPGTLRLTCSMGMYTAHIQFN